MASVLSFLVMAVLVATIMATEWPYPNKRLVGRVVHIETLEVRGKWAKITDHHDGTSYKYYIGWKSLAISDVYYECNVQYLVSETPDGYLMFESVCDQFRNRYLGAGWPTGSGRETVMLSEVFYTPDSVAHHWRVKCEDGDLLENCQIVSKRWESRRMTYTWQGGYNCFDAWWLTLGPFSWDNWTFRIYAPNPSDKMVEVAQLDNCDSDSTEEYTREIKLGMSQTQTSSHTIESSTSIEVGGAFKSFSASASTSISSSWSDESSSTFSQEVTTSLKVYIKARTFVVVEQLVGNYDNNFEVRAETYKTVDKSCDAKSTEPPMIRVWKNVKVIDLTDEKNLPEPSKGHMEL